jgi:hypothetical protein
MVFYGRYGGRYGIVPEIIAGAIGASRPGATLEIFPGGPHFGGGDTYKIFFDDGTSAWARGAEAYGLSWTKPSNALITTVGNVWTALSISDNPSDQAFMIRMKAELKTLAASVDQLAGVHDIFGYTQQVTSQLISRMTELKRKLQTVASYKPQPPSVPKTEVTGVAYTPTTSPSVSRAAIVATGAKPAWFFPAIIGGGVLLLGGLIFALTGKKKPAMAGYRRNRIRR